MGILKANLEWLLGFWEVQEKTVKLGFEGGGGEERRCISLCV